MEGPKAENENADTWAQDPWTPGVSEEQGQAGPPAPAVCAARSGRWAPDSHCTCVLWAGAVQWCVPASRQLQRGAGSYSRKHDVSTCSTKVPPLQRQRQTRLHRTSVHGRQIKPLKSRTLSIAKSCHASENQQQKHQTWQKKLHKGRVNGTKRRILLKEDIPPSKETTKDLRESKSK